MEYRITVVRTEENPNYKEELTNYEKFSHYNRPFNQPEPQPKITKDVLITVLTEEQYKAAQKAIIEAF